MLKTYNSKINNCSTKNKILNCKNKNVFACHFIQ